MALLGMRVGHLDKLLPPNSSSLVWLVLDRHTDDLLTLLSILGDLESLRKLRLLCSHFQTCSLN